MPEADGAGAAWLAAFCRLARDAALGGLRELDRLDGGRAEESGDSGPRPALAPA